MRVYLAGPIAGTTEDEANGWRHDVAERLKAAGMKPISPLRREPSINGRYELSYGDPLYGTPKAIASKNEFDVRSCDWVIAYLPKVLNDRRPSYGTVGEIAMAYMIGKPVVLVTDDPRLADHPLVQLWARWILSSLDQAVELTIGTLDAYA